MKVQFRSVALASSLLCLGLAAVWILSPGLLLWIWQVERTDSALLVARRSGCLFLALGLMLFAAREAPPSPLRQAMATGLAVGCAGLALTGILDLLAGRAGIGILLAIGVELAVAYGLVSTRGAADEPVAPRIGT